jgi:hypothetical protein
MESGINIKVFAKRGEKNPINFVSNKLDHRGESREMFSVCYCFIADFSR